MPITIAYLPMREEDCREAMKLWRAGEGFRASACAESQLMERFLRRNPELSKVAWHNRVMVGAVLVGHDGRSGYIHHLAVACAYRRSGIGRGLIRAALADLDATGIHEVHFFADADNLAGRAFWASLGWRYRSDLLVFSRSTDLSVASR
ncbi:GNAT family N-acetyltransferase [Niveibacterium sp.]|uniref:GNAT family N-acetyltransferase n=1 Tax=Niveibacterium sp. TaxID=2017444 RepID=UPI0035B27ACD